MYKGIVAKVHCYSNYWSKSSGRYPYYWLVLNHWIGWFKFVVYCVNNANVYIQFAGDQVIPAGAGVIVSLYNIHHSPLFYTNPTEWDPHHFDIDVAASRPANAFMPFGFGPRKCIGECSTTSKFQSCLHEIKIIRILMETT